MARGRVLIVEDEPMVQMLLEELCEASDCDVIAVVDNVAEALEAVKRDDYNVVILDVNLRKETSEEVALALKAMGKMALVSTGLHPSHLHPAYKDFAVLLKPFKPTEVQRLLAQTAF